MQGHGQEVDVAEALGNRHGFDGRLVSAVVVGRGLMPEHHGKQEISAFDAVFSLPLDDPLGATEPAARGSDLARDCEVHAEKDSDARRQ